VPRSKIAAALQNRVRRRAKGLCEYCHTAEAWQYVSFTVDHIVPLAEGGAAHADNLALACFHCNRQKGVRETEVDPQTGRETPLFHPRRQRWGDHFAWSPDQLTVVGLTSVGRATVQALRFNRERVQAIRAADIAVNRHPPQDDLTLPA
jgi:hypothetical protein